MTDNIDPRLAKERDRVKAAKERLDKATAREKAIVAELEVSKRLSEITQGVQGAVKEALSNLKLNIPSEGLTLFVHADSEGNGFGVDVKIGRGKSGNGNGNRKSISDLGHSGFILANGTKVDSAAAVLDHFKHPHKGDSAARLLLSWTRDNPDKAETVKVIIGKEKVSLVEAVSRI